MKNLKTVMLATVFAFGATAAFAQSSTSPSGPVPGTTVGSPAAAASDVNNPKGAVAPAGAGQMTQPGPTGSGSAGAAPNRKDQAEKATSN